MNEVVSPGLSVSASRLTELGSWDEETGSSSISNRNTVPENEAFQMGWDRTADPNSVNYMAELTSASVTK